MNFGVRLARQGWFWGWMEEFLPLPVYNAASVNGELKQFIAWETIRPHYKLIFRSIDRSLDVNYRMAWDLCRTACFFVGCLTPCPTCWNIRKSLKRTGQEENFLPVRSSLSAVHAPLLEGSYEPVPPSLRWFCSANTYRNPHGRAIVFWWYFHRLLGQLFLRHHNVRVDPQGREGCTGGGGTQKLCKSYKQKLLKYYWSYANRLFYVHG